MKFIDVHTDMKGIDQNALQAAHDQTLESGQQEGVQFLHAWADPEAGKVFCLTEAPNKEAVQRAHERAGAAPNEIYEISLEA